jgi:S1-C subfamily serine protease
MKTYRVVIPWTVSVLLAASLACSTQISPSFIATVIPPLATDVATSLPAVPTGAASQAAQPTSLAQDTPASATSLPGSNAATPLPTLTPVPTLANRTSNPEEQQLEDLYARVSPSIVSILVDLGSQGGAQATGFVFDTAGHIVTNQHVVDGATSIEIDFPSGVKLLGKVLGSDPDSDLAVIAVQGDAGKLTPLPLGDSDQVKVGQTVVAIGNPFGYAGTMTVGVVSGLGRTVASNRAAPGGGSYTAPDIIQTDAAINPGNSGGPLLNLDGQVVGINKALESQTGVNSGIGFAVASNTVRQIVPYLIQNGRYVYPFLGMSAQEDISLQLAQQLHLPQANGVYVASVVPGGPVAQGGLKGDSASQNQQLRGDGDLIVAIDGHTVQVFSQLMSYLVNSTRPGQVITLSILRGGKPMDLKVTLGTRP